MVVEPGIVAFKLWCLDLVELEDGLLLYPAARQFKQDTRIGIFVRYLDYFTEAGFDGETAVVASHNRVGAVGADDDAIAGEDVA